MGPIFRRWTSPATRTSWNAPSPRYLFERKKETDPESKYPTIQRSNFFGKKWLVKRMGWFKKLSKIIQESSGISLSNKLMKWHDSFVKIARNLSSYPHYDSLEKWLGRWFVCCMMLVLEEGIIWNYTPQPRMAVANEGLGWNPLLNK